MDSKQKATNVFWHEGEISREDRYKILPQINEWGKDSLRIKNGKKVSEGFIYDSHNNKDWMKKAELKKWIDINLDFIGKL